jgi:hypothetical protein
MSEIVSLNSRSSLIPNLFNPAAFERAYARRKRMST